MIEQLISLVSTFWNHIIPFFVIDEYEQAVTLRLGRYYRTVYPGLHLKIPFVDQVLTETVVMNAYNLASQALTTKDNKEIIVAAVVKYTISDIKKFVLEITDEDSAIPDICLGVIRASLTSKTWLECQDKTVDTYITNKVRGELSNYGIAVDKVRLTDMTRVRAFRLFTDGGMMALIFSLWLSFGSGWDYNYKTPYYYNTLNYSYKDLYSSVGGYADRYNKSFTLDLSYNFTILK